MVMSPNVQSLLRRNFCRMDLSANSDSSAGPHIRARDLGIPLEGTPGAYNAITDVAGVLVGHHTLIQGEGPLNVGYGPVRTGVTAVLPRGRHYDPLFAGCYSLNGHGGMTRTIWGGES